MAGSIPVLEISAFRASGPSGAAGSAFVAELLAACHGPGFAYITGHGIDPSAEAELFESARAFFALPEAERKALAILNSAAFRGYTVLGDERTAGTSDWREQLDFGPEQAAEVPAAMPAWRRLRGPNQWPGGVPLMQPRMLAWMAAMEALGLDVMRALAVGLGVPMDTFDTGFIPNSDFHVKMIHYPEQPAASSSQQGVGPHQDSGLVTFILQDAVGGLQVLLDGEFVDVPPKSGAYVLNLGQMMQRATDGYLRATQHRVLSPPAGVDRVSIAFFMNPRFETRFEPVALSPDLTAQAAGGDNNAAADPISTLFGENNLKVRLRSHPDVARRHYADVPVPPSSKL